jgi:hypothetical protein
VVTISIGVNTAAALFRSLASNVPALITTADNSVTSSFNTISIVNVPFPSSFIVCSKGL